MTSEPLGTPVSAVEVSHISSFGVWLLAHGAELYMSYEDFPWFRDAPIGKVLNVEEPTPNHFYWPELDVDLSVDIIEHPDRFPLKATYSLSCSRRYPSRQGPIPADAGTP